MLLPIVLESFEITIRFSDVWTFEKASSAKGSGAIEETTILGWLLYPVVWGVLVSLAIIDG